VCALVNLSQETKSKRRSRRRHGSTTTAPSNNTIKIKSNQSLSSINSLNPILSIDEVGVWCVLLQVSVVGVHQTDANGLGARLLAWTCWLDDQLIVTAPQKKEDSKTWTQWYPKQQSRIIASNRSRTA
jgi:hypothetical protein